MADNTDEMIRQAYQIVAEPSRLAELQVSIERALDTGFGDGKELDAHFAQAGILFDAISNLEPSDFSKFGVEPPQESEGSLWASSPVGQAVLCLDNTLHVSAIDGPDRDADTIQIGDDFRTWLAGDLKETERALGNLLRSPPNGGSIILRFHLGDSDTKGTLAVATRQSGNPNREIRIHRIALAWSDAVGREFAQNLDLTQAETELVRFIVEGQTVNEFAQARGRAVGTARNQLKSVLRKLAIGSQSELVSLYAGFASSFALHKAGITRSKQRAFGHGITLPDGSDILYERYGKAGGRTVLMLHGALEGPFLPPRTEQAAANSGLELLVPWMPFYTGACADLDAAARVEAFVANLVAFLDAMGIEDCPIVACSLSTAYALALVDQFPGRAKGLVLAGMALPITEIAQDTPINPAWRAPMLLGQRSPRFFELFVRTVFRLAMRGQAHHYVDRLFKDSEVDLGILRQPDIAMTMRRSAENRPDRFGAAMAHGFTLMTLDWSRWLSSREVPIRLVVGEEDVVTTPEQMLAFARRRQVDLIGPIVGLGGFSLFQRPELIFAEARALDDR